MARKEDVVPPHELMRTLVSQLRRVKTNPGLAGYKPHPKQEEFHRSKNKGKMLMGGNRSGKTVGCGAEAAMRLTGEHPFRDDLPKPPVRGRGVAVDNDRGIKLIMIPELKKWIPQKYLINGSWEDSYSKTDKILTLNNGSTMEFMTYEQDVDKFQGTSRHFTWFDEEPPEGIFNECMLRLVDTDGDWFMSMTPLIEMSWTYDTLYVPAKEGNSYVSVWEMSIADNPHINMDAFDRLTSTLTQNEKETRKTGVYISHTGLIYGESFRTDGNVCPDIINSSRWPILRDSWSHFQMMDHGYNNHTAILFGAYNYDGMVIIYDEIYVNKTLVKDIAEEWNLRRKILSINTEYVVGDPNIASKSPLNGFSVQQEYGTHGIYIALGNNDVDNGIILVQRMFKEQQLIITERCVNLLKELRKYRWDRHLTKARDRKNQKETPVKKDDHACDALRYGIMSRPRKYFEEQQREELPDIHIVSPVTGFDAELMDRNNQIIDSFLGSEV